MHVDNRVFEPLPMRVRTMIPVKPNQYKVVSESGETCIVDAMSAYEAFVQSGFKQSIKISRTTEEEIILVNESHFLDHPNEEAHEETPEEIIEKRFYELKRKKNPIISADDLYNLMTTWQHKAEQESTYHPTENTSPEPTTTSFVASNAINDTYQEHESILRDTATIGVDVQGDGFDEIIPPSQNKTPNKKGSDSEPVTANVASDVNVEKENNLSTEEENSPPAQELSPEEVEKLLKGNNE